MHSSIDSLNNEIIKDFQVDILDFELQIEQLQSHCKLKNSLISGSSSSFDKATQLQVKIYHLMKNLYTEVRQFHQYYTSLQAELLSALQDLAVRLKFTSEQISEIENSYTFYADQLRLVDAALSLIDGEFNGEDFNTINDQVILDLFSKITTLLNAITPHIPLLHKFYNEMGLEISDDNSDEDDFVAALSSQDNQYHTNRHYSFSSDQTVQAMSSSDDSQEGETGYQADIEDNTFASEAENSTVVLKADTSFLPHMNMENSDVHSIVEENSPSASADDSPAFISGDDLPSLPTSADDEPQPLIQPAIIALSTLLYPLLNHISFE